MPVTLDLSPAQQFVVDHRGTGLQVIACAGSEKTEPISRRVAERIASDFRDCLGPMFVGTIYAYCFRILQDHVPCYGNHDVLDERRRAGFLSRE